MNPMQKRKAPTQQPKPFAVNEQAASASDAINAKTSTVEGRITGLLSKDNDYMKQAAFQGRAEANSRGLLSSSMGVEAAQSARIRAALPIAQQDASLYGQAGLQDASYAQQGNLQAKQGLIQRAHNTQQGDITRTNMTHQGGITRENATHQGGITRENNAASLNQQFSNQSQLNNQNFGHQSQLQEASHSQQLAAQNNSAQNNTAANSQTQIAAVMSNPNLAPEQQQAMVDNINRQTNYTMNVQAGIRESPYTFASVAPAPAAAQAPASPPPPPVRRPATSSNWEPGGSNR